jgi:hypothetical protein
MAKVRSEFLKMDERARYSLGPLPEEVTCPRSKIHRLINCQFFTATD